MVELLKAHVNKPDERARECERARRRAYSFASAGAAAIAVAVFAFRSSVGKFSPENFALCLLVEHKNTLT